MKKPPTTKEKKNFPIVAIGASAGGLEAVGQLLSHLPTKTGMAYFYIQHLSPDFKSLLPSLLARFSRIKMVQARDAMKVEADNFYIIPPNKEMTLLDGHIRLEPRSNKSILTYPIDTFFTSLAERHKKNIVGIVLSGSANDGTDGLKAIKEAGGITFAQDQSAKFAGMPESAVNEGVVDFILPPEEIGKRLGRLAKQLDGSSNGAFEQVDENEFADGDGNFKSILEMLYRDTGVDFLYYKMNTIKRRVLRRMRLNNIVTIKDYAKLVTQNHHELNLLYHNLLINVTGFFRDSEAYRYLKSTLLPKLIKSKAKGETLRIWVPACSTGEEAYSIAMQLLDLTGGKQGHSFLIFGTDLSDRAIAKARKGEYTQREVANVPPHYLKHFFKKVREIYVIEKALRDMCVLAPHNILRDPPFSHLDLISCSNLLIYFDPKAQRKVLTTFHYALNEEGYLLLGNSETTGASKLFTPLNTKVKAYQRKKNSGTGRLPDLSTHLMRHMPHEEQQKKERSTKKAADAPGLSSMIDSVLYSNYMPACVVINSDMEILQFRGHTSFYLVHSQGKASLNVLKMVRPEIAFELRTAIQRVFKTGVAVKKNDIELKTTDGLHHFIELEVTQLKINWNEPLLLILFRHQQAVEAIYPAGKKVSANVAQKDRKIKKLQEEVTSYRGELNTVAENHEVSIEKLQSANEEILSSNEELQTLNEELGTSKEEIQSTNEELFTINQELQMRNDSLVEAQLFSDAIIATIRDGLVVLDKDLRVRVANKSFYDLFGLSRETTEGFRLYELRDGLWNTTQIRDLLEEVITKQSFIKDYALRLPIPGLGERMLMLNANRVIQPTKNEPLLLMAVTDITESTVMKTKQEELQHAVSEKTKEIKQANETLVQKNKDLAKMNKDLESFAYISSHDLQEPLRIVRSFANLIIQKETENLSANGKDYLLRIQDSISRMQTLIDDLLSYSRTNTAERKFEKMHISKIVEQVKAAMRVQLAEKTAVIEMNELCEVNMIPFQFRQLMQNLISNSLKFSKKDVPPRIKIESYITKGSTLKNERLMPDREYCHLSVEDNGIGFEPRFNERIFEIFQRLHGRNEYSGTGIGLAIVKKIVDNHGGIITASSEAGEGARFDIYIPV